MNKMYLAKQLVAIGRTGLEAGGIISDLHKAGVLSPGLRTPDGVSMHTVGGAWKPTRPARCTAAHKANSVPR